MAKFIKYFKGDLCLWFHCNSFKCLKYFNIVELICSLKKHKCKTCPLNNFCNKHVE